MAKRRSGKRRSGSLGSLSVVELQRELRRRHTAVKRLERKRSTLLRRVADLDAQIAASGGSVTGRVIARRQKNEGTLVDALYEALKNKTMGVTEVAEYVRAHGYKSEAPSFRTIVNQALVASGKFRRVSRGQYTSK